MKEFVTKLCQEEYGHLLLLAAFDCIDDTVLVSKSLIAVIVLYFTLWFASCSFRFIPPAANHEVAAGYHYKQVRQKSSNIPSHAT